MKLSRRLKGASRKIARRKAGTKAKYQRARKNLALHDE